jgi:hypothetical protein
MKYLFDIEKENFTTNLRLVDSWLSNEWRLEIDDSSTSEDIIYTEYKTHFFITPFFCFNYVEELATKRFMLNIQFLKLDFEFNNI